jgi:hypothetical protein
MTYASIEESGWEGVAKIIVVESKGRTCRDEMEMKWWVIAMNTGVATPR